MKTSTAARLSLRTVALGYLVLLIGVPIVLIL